MAISGRIENEDHTITNLGEVLNASLGQRGAEFISDTAAHTPATGKVFAALQIIDDALLSAYAPAFSGNTFTGVQLVAGTVIYGRFTSITLTSGKILAYLGV